MNKLYIDTNIFLNIFLEEEKFYQSSKNLFDKIENNLEFGIISIFTLMEICRILQKNRFSQTGINKVINQIKGLNLEIIVPSEFHLTIAYELINELNIDVLDALHLSVAINETNVFVTRDMELTKKIKGKITLKIPENI